MEAVFCTSVNNKRTRTKKQKNKLQTKYYLHIIFKRVSLACSIWLIRRSTLHHQPWACWLWRKKKKRQSTRESFCHLSLCSRLLIFWAKQPISDFSDLIFLTAGPDAGSSCWIIDVPDIPDGQRSARCFLTFTRTQHALSLHNHCLSFFPSTLVVLFLKPVHS